MDDRDDNENFLDLSVDNNQWQFEFNRQYINIQSQASTAISEVKSVYMQGASSMSNSEAKAEQGLQDPATLDELKQFVLNLGKQMNAQFGIMRTKFDQLSDKYTIMLLRLDYNQKHCQELGSITTEQEKTIKDLKKANKNQEEEVILFKKKLELMLIDVETSSNEKIISIQEKFAKKCESLQLLIIKEQNTIEANVNDRLTKFEANTNDKFTKFEVNTNDKLTRFEANTNHRLTKFEVNTNHSLTKFDTNTNDRLTKFETNINERFSKLSQTNEKSYQKLTNKTLDLEKSTKNTINQFQNKTDKAKVQFEAKMDGKINSFVKGIESDMRKLQTKIQASIESEMEKKKKREKNITGQKQEVLKMSSIKKSEEIVSGYKGQIGLSKVTEYQPYETQIVEKSFEEDDIPLKARIRIMRKFALIRRQLFMTFRDEIKLLFNAFKQCQIDMGLFCFTIEKMFKWVKLLPYHNVQKVTIANQQCKVAFIKKIEANFFLEAVKLIFPEYYTQKNWKLLQNLQARLKKQQKDNNKNKHSEYKIFLQNPVYFYQFIATMLQLVDTDYNLSKKMRDRYWLQQIVQLIENKMPEQSNPLTLYCAISCSIIKKTDPNGKKQRELMQMLGISGKDKYFKILEKTIEEKQKNNE